MSDFSDCYYLRTRDSKRVAALLKRARRHGMILPSSRAWIPFLVDGVLDAGSAAEDVVQNNGDLLLHCAHAEDHGLCIALYDGARSSFSVEFQRRGPSELDVTRIRLETARLQLVADARKLDAILSIASLAAPLDIEDVRRRVSELLDFEVLAWLSCADITRQPKELQSRFPGAEFVLASLRGKADKARMPSPNEWCPTPGLPAFMYLPVPSGEIDDEELTRHVHHWVSTGDFDDDKQVGFWMHSAYRRALPSRFAYLAERIMNLQVVFPDCYEEALRQTISGVLAVSPKEFDWQPYLARTAGEQRI